MAARETGRSLPRLQCRVGRMRNLQANRGFPAAPWVSIKGLKWAVIGPDWPSISKPSP